MLRILLFLVLGFAVGVLAAYVLVSALSGNTHDLSVEATMTAIFVGGPVGAIVGVVVAIVTRRKT